MAPNLLAWCLVAWRLYEVVTGEYVSFFPVWLAATLLPLATAASIAIVWLALLAWKAPPRSRVKLAVAYVVACVALWASSVGLAFVTSEDVI